MLVGMSLVATGTTLQAIFRYPLVDLYILGLASGAAFGAALALAFLPVPVQLSAFIFGFIAVIIAYSVALNRGTVVPITLVLAGVMTSAIFTALLAVVNMLVDPLKLRARRYQLCHAFL